jgi:hypothetical protein
MADILASLLDLSKVSMLNQDKLARLIFSKVKSFAPLNISKTELLPII